MPVIPPFTAHTNLMVQYEQFLGGGNPSLAYLTFQTLVTGITVPVTHTEIRNGYSLIPGGRSPELMIERCEFRSVLIPDQQNKYLIKGLECTLKPNPTSHVFKLQLWDGGLVPGGEIYRFMLVSANYKG